MKSLNSFQMDKFMSWIVQNDNGYKLFLVRQ